MDQKPVAIVGVTLLLLLSAFAIPTILAATEDPQITETELSPGDTFEITGGLEITVVSVTNSEVTVDLFDVQTRQNESLTIAEGATANYTLPGGDGSVTNLDSTNQAAMLEITFDPAYGWSPGAEVLLNNIGIVLIMVLFVIVISGLIVVIQ